MMGRVGDKGFLPAHLERHTSSHSFVVLGLSQTISSSKKSGFRNTQSGSRLGWGRPLLSSDPRPLEAWLPVKGPGKKSQLAPMVVLTIGGRRCWL